MSSSIYFAVVRCYDSGTRELTPFTLPRERVAADKRANASAMLPGAQSTTVAPAVTP
jgi:hypothetical protein